MAQAFHKTARNVMTHSRVLQEEVRSKLPDAVGIAVPVVDDVYEEHSSEIAVRLADARGSGEPMTPIEMPASVV